MHKNHFNQYDKPYKDQKRWRRGFKKFCARHQNVQRRRKDKRHIHAGSYEEIRTLDEPRNTWMWD